MYKMFNRKEKSRENEKNIWDLSNWKSSEHQVFNSRHRKTLTDNWNQIDVESIENQNIRRKGLEKEFGIIFLNYTVDEKNMN